MVWVDGLPVIHTPRLCLRIARPNEGGKIARYLRRNREHLRPWEPLRSEAYFEDSFHEPVPAQDADHAQTGKEFRFRILDRSGEGEFQGTVAIRDIWGWPLHMAVLGYSIDAQHAGKGYASEAAGAAVDFAFQHLAIHRIEACYMPANKPSERVLQKLGFQREGLLRESLMVNGRWEDHVLTAKLNENWAIDSLS